MDTFWYGIALPLHLTGQGLGKLYHVGLGASFKLRDRRLQASASERPSPYKDSTQGYDRYSYRPLPSASHIRVLVLEAGNGQDPVHCSLAEVDLASDPQFEAISYCWSGPLGERSVFCEAKALNVTRNLYEALLHLRRPNATRCLWADAICINQEDNPERTQQVRLMQRIYGDCERCLVWLGQHVKEDASAFKVLSIICEALRAEQPPTEPRHLAPGKKPFSPLSTTPGQWIALSHLLARAWFERMWTLQEVVLPRKVLMICGKFQCDVDDFYTAFDNIRKHELDGHLPERGAGYWLCLKGLAARREFHQQQRAEGSLLDVLRDTRERDAGDPRDKVFAVFGLCRPTELGVLSVGYQNSIVEVYTMVAWHVLKTYEKPLRLLSAASPPASDKRQPLPSWVPDWSERQALPPCIHDFEIARGFSAGGVNVSSISTYESSDDTPCLVLRGKAISNLCAFVDKNSIDLHRQFQEAHGGPTTCGGKFVDCYMYIAVGWFFEFLSPDEQDRPDRTIEQFFLEQCWDQMTRMADLKARVELFWRTLTREANNREAKAFQGEILDYMRWDSKHDVKNQSQVTFLYDLEAWTCVRKFCRTGDGRIGWVPLAAQAGDWICVFEGCDLPFVIRKLDDKAGVVIVGHCYISGIMHGEMMADNKVPFQDILLR